MDLDAGDMDVSPRMTSGRLRQLCPSARVRLAATRALSDGGKVSTARVEETAKSGVEGRAYLGYINKPF